jgi:hypothetical protein
MIIIIIKKKDKEEACKSSSFSIVIVLVRGKKKTSNAYELIVTLMNTAVHFSLPLVTSPPLSSSGEERGREEQHMMLFLFSRAE